jgi:hypothetical protein
MLSPDRASSPANRAHEMTTVQESRRAPLQPAHLVSKDLSSGREFSRSQVMVTARGLAFTYLTRRLTALGARRRVSVRWVAHEQWVGNALRRDVCMVALLKGGPGCSSFSRT